MKECRICKLPKEEIEFHKNNQTKDKLDRRCKLCYNNWYKDYYIRKKKESYKIQNRHNALIWRKKHPDICRAYFLKRNFDLTIDEHKLMFEKQNGCCAICGIHQSKLSRELDVDHCHDTKKVRGLLCSQCNTGIGKLKHSIELLNKSITYLKGES